MALDHDPASQRGSIEILRRDPPNLEQRHSGRIRVVALTALLVTVAGRHVAQARSSVARGSRPAASGALLSRPAETRVRFETMRRDGGHFVAQLADGRGEARLTLNPALQDAAEETFRTFDLPYAAAVVVSIPDGRVLAMAGHSSREPQLGAEELALQPWAPAASVFKVVSASALISEAGLHAGTRTCYHGGVSAVLPDNLVDMPSIDHACATLAYGIEKSQNAIMAKLASRHLSAPQLERVAQAFGFGQTIPFELPVGPSQIEVPADNPLEFARTAAGFWHSRLSPLHGALLAAAIANGGEMPAPHLVERTAHEMAGATSPLRRVVPAAVAHEVGRMMELVTRGGTARHGFHDRRGHRYLPVEVAGKTGTLSEQTEKGFVGYSWFVGYAPAQRPTIAFAVAIGNRANWRIKATYVARRLIAEYLADSKPAHPTRLLATR